MERSPYGEIELRPVVTKSYLKGAIAIAVFSLVLEINSSTFFNYLQFLGIWFVLVSIYALYKYSSTYILSEDSVVVHSPFKKPETIRFTDVLELSIAQGVLAKRFNCGSVFLALKQGKGNVRFMSGGGAVMLKDVRNPQKIMDEISSHLSPFGY